MLAGGFFAAEPPRNDKSIRVLQSIQSSRLFVNYFVQIFTHSLFPCVFITFQGRGP